MPKKATICIGGGLGLLGIIALLGILRASFLPEETGRLPQPLTQSKPAISGRIMQIPLMKKCQDYYWDWKWKQKLRGKLQAIKFQKVEFEKVPLREVMKQISLTSKRNDPEKKGINFLMNAPWPPADLLNGKAYDIAEVRVTVKPLTQVSLKEVLDAVVKGADAPIIWKTEPYGVCIMPEKLKRETGLTPVSH